MADLRINPNAEIQKIEKAKTSRKASRSKPLESAKDSDAVKLSDNAQLLSKIPPVREEKVNEVRSQLEKGTYVTEEKMKKALKNLLQDL